MDWFTYSEFADMPVPDPPALVPDWKRIYKEGPSPRKRDPDRISMNPTKNNYHMTVKEISKHFDVAPVTIDRIIVGALEKLRATLHEQSGINDRSKLMRSMLFLEEKTNFFNPNQGGMIWHTLRSLSSM